jgi:DNA-binding protein H-NS
MPTYVELQAEAHKLLQEAEVLKRQELKGVIGEIKQKMAQYGITPKDLGFSVGGNSKIRRQKPSGVPAIAKYISPEGEKWSGGRGRKPDWVKQMLAQGRRLEDFLIPGQ